jgi:phosphatidylserine decarboxylase
LGILRSVRFLFSPQWQYIQFHVGGSTIVILFEKGMVQWDEDLLINGRAALETLVRVGMGIGRGRANAA